MQHKKLTIVNKLGLHARAAMKLESTASRFQSDIKVTCKNSTIDGKDILQVMSLGAATGTPIEISADGPDEDRAITALADLINDKFGEGE